MKLQTELDFMFNLFSAQNAKVKQQEKRVDKLNKQLAYMLSLLEKQVQSSKSKDSLVSK